MLAFLFDSQSLLFTVPALLGTVLLLARMGLMVLGGDADADVDVDVDVDGMDVPEDVSTHAFTVVSINSIIALVMGFGWGGLIGQQTLGWDLPRSIILGVAFGVALMWLMAVLLKFVYDLQSSGNVNIDEAMGKEGSVYATVPGDGAGRGQVRLVLDGRARIYNAVTHGEPIPTNTAVRVTHVNKDNTLTVIRA